MKIISIVGARPQFIKATPLSLELRKHFNEILLHTGQHFDYEMSDIFFRQLNIPKPKYNLNIRETNHGVQTGKMLEKIESVLLKENPDLVIVFGDTNSTLAGALAAVKLHIPVAHVEAGLRSYNNSMPEEINRILTDKMSSLLFVPSKHSENILKSEGINKGVYITGDIMYDSILHFKKIAKQKSNIKGELKVKKNNFILATIHRAENTDVKNNLAAIFEIFADCNKSVILPVHPRTKNKLSQFKIKINSNIILIPPVSYLDMINLLDNAECVLTDSGGVQKEAYYLATPCITLRNETEWIETIKSGWNILSGINKLKVKTALKKLQVIIKLKRPDIYGNGKTAKIITDIIFKNKKQILEKKYFNK